MKKNIIYIILGFIILTVSCKEDEVTYYNLGTEFIISATDYTSLDNQVTITIDNQQKNLTDIVVTHLGGLKSTKDEDGEYESFDPPSANLGNIAISAGAGTLVLTDARLGMTEIDWNCDLKFNTVYNGLDVFRELHINVDDPISTHDPHITHRSDTIFHFKFEIEPGSAIVETISIETKVSAAGTYVAESGSFNAIDSVAFTGADFTTGDTIYVKVTGTVGVKTASTVTKLVVNPYTFKKLKTVAFVLDSSYVNTYAYDFIEARKVGALTVGDSADIQLTTTPVSGGYTMGFVLNNNAEFVAGSKAQYAYADSIDIVSADFSTPITFNNDVAEGDIYFFRTKRGVAGDYTYGILKVVAVIKPQGVLEDSSIEFEFKY